MPTGRRPKVYLRRPVNESGQGGGLAICQRFDIYIKPALHRSGWNPDSMPRPNVDTTSLPDFASARTVLRFLLLGLLIAAVIVLGRHAGFTPQAWQELALLSAFASAIVFGGLITLRLALPLLSAPRRGSARCWCCCCCCW